MSIRIKTAAIVALLVICIAVPTFAQRANDKPRVSPNASVSQTIGTTVITIEYGRPGVKGRAIWGSLVPYDAVWRTGANEATMFEITSDIMVEGQKLPAGTYSFFAIPTTGSWTIIFNRVAKQWGHFNYDASQDQLRVEVTPQPAENSEWLMYYFKDTTANEATCVLHWEKLAVPFKITVQ